MREKMNTPLSNSVVAFLFLVLLLASSFPIEGAPPAENIFTTHGCVLCHSLEGEKTAGKGPAVSSMPEFTSLLDFGASLWNHGPETIRNMESLRVAVPKLEGKDIASLISYIAFYRYYNTDRMAAGNATRGEIAWKGLKCSGCHSLEGESGKKGPVLHNYQNFTPVQMAQAMWAHGPKMTDTMGSHGIHIPRLSGEDIIDILAFIRSRAGLEQRVLSKEVGDPIRGAEVFKNKQCQSCHPVVEDSAHYGPQFERKPEYSKGTAGVAALMWNHSVGMRQQFIDAKLSLPVFKGTEMADLLAYLYLSAYSDKPGNAVVGKKLFEIKKCLGCHVAEASARRGSTPALNLVASMWNHLAGMGKGKAETPFPQIKPGEMKDLVAYLETNHLTLR